MNRGNWSFQTFGCHGTGGSLRSRGYNVKINMEGEMNMLLCLYNLLTGSLVSVLRVQVLFLNRYALLLRRRCALYSVCLNYEIPFKPYNERRFWVRRGRTFPEQLAGGTVCNSICLYAYIKWYIKYKHFSNFSQAHSFNLAADMSC